MQYFLNCFKRGKRTNGINRSTSRLLLRSQYYCNLKPCKNMWTLTHKFSIKYFANRIQVYFKMITHRACSCWIYPREKLTCWMFFWGNSALRLWCDYYQLLSSVLTLRTRRIKQRKTWLTWSSCQKTPCKIGVTEAMVLKILSLKGTKDFSSWNVKDAMSICQELVKFLPLQIQGYDIVYAVQDSHYTTVCSNHRILISRFIFRFLSGFQSCFGPIPPFYALIPSFGKDNAYSELLHVPSCFLRFYKDL